LKFINHARILGIGTAALLWTASGFAQAQTIPSNVARPLNAAANLLGGGQAASGYAPYGYSTPVAPYQYAAPTAPSYRYAPGYGWTTTQPTYSTYTPAQPGYPTTYYQSGYNGYVQRRAIPYSVPGQRSGVVNQQTNPVSRALNQARSIVQPQRYAYPTYSYPGYAPTYVQPR